MICGDVTLTYAELGERAVRLAGYLVGLGAGPERLVAVVMEKSAEVFVAWLGVAMSGAAFLPVDPAYPAERIGFMLADARPDVVVTTAAAAGSLPAGRAGGRRGWCWTIRWWRRCWLGLGLAVRCCAGRSWRMRRM